MAEDVIIAGIDGLPEWASEKTQAELLKQLEKIYKLSEKQAREMNRSITEMRRGSTPSGNSTLSKNMKEQKKVNNLLSGTTTGLKSFGVQVSGTKDGLAYLNQGPLPGFGKGLEALASKMGVAGGVIAILAGQAGAALKAFKVTVDTFRQLNEAGITVRGGIVGFQESLADVGMTVEELGSISAKYARTVGNIGIEAIVDMSTAADGAIEQFTRFGITTAEAVEYQTALLEQQRLAGIFQVRDQREQNNALQENIKRLTAYSRILNVSRQEILDQRQALKSRADVQRLFQSMPDEIRLAASRSFDQASDLFAALGPEIKPIADYLTDMIASPIEQNAESFKILSEASPELAQEMVELARRVKSGSSVTVDSLQGITDILDRQARSGIFEALALSQDRVGETANMLGGPFLNALRNAEERIAGYAMETEEGASVTDTMANAVNGSVQQLTRLDSAIQIATAGLEYFRIETFGDLLGAKGEDIIKFAADAVLKANDYIQMATDYEFPTFLEMLRTVNEWIDRFFLAPLANVGSAIADFILAVQTTINDIVGWFQQLGTKIDDLIQKMTAWIPFFGNDENIVSPSAPPRSRGSRSEKVVPPTAAAQTAPGSPQVAPGTGVLSLEELAAQQSATNEKLDFIGRRLTDIYSQGNAM